MRQNWIQKLTIVGSIGILLLPLTASAATVRLAPKKGDIRIPASETINDDLYVAGGNVVVEGNIKGDLLVAGGQVRVTGAVSGDVMAAGGNITIEGPVGDDIRVAGGNILIRSQVVDDLLVAGGTVEVAREAVIGGDVRAGTGQLTIAGTTGPVYAGVGKMALESTAHIKGDIHYMSQEMAAIASEATITGHVIHTQPQPRVAGREVKRVIGVGVFLSLLSTIIMALLFVWVVPTKAAALAQVWRKHFGRNLLWAILFMIVTPIVCAILMVTGVGIPLGVGLLFLYIIMLYLGYLVAVLATGTWIRQRFMPEHTRLDWVAVVFGVLALMLVGYIPIVGLIIVALAMLSGLGALLNFDWNLVKKLRADKTI